jgi:hypothetical protein
MTEFDTFIAYHPDINKNLSLPGVACGHFEVNKELLLGIMMVSSLLFKSRCADHILISAKGEVLDIDPDISSDKIEKNGKGNYSRVVKIFDKDNTSVCNLFFINVTCKYGAYISIDGKKILLQSDSLHFFRGVDSALTWFYNKINTCYITEFYSSREKRMIKFR